MKIIKNKNNQEIAIIERDTHLSKWVIEHDRLDFDINALPTYLPYFPKGGTLINIGANIGCYAYAFKDVANEIHCFEPNLEAFACLYHNLSKYPQFHLYSNAISDKRTKYIVDNECDNVGMAFVVEDIYGIKDTVTIDYYDFEKVDMFLIDCEGFELKALKGAKDTITKYKPILVIEINDTTLARQDVNRQQIFDWLTENNYIYRNIYKEQGLNDSQLDIICTPK